jgi:hypothetical protein
MFKRGTLTGKLTWRPERVVRVKGGDVAACGVAVGFASSAGLNLSVALRLVSLWMCSKRAAGNVKSPNGVTVCQETLERWYDWYDY